ILNWTSQSEINSAKYELETSLNASTFATVATIPSANISTGSIYSYTYKSLKKGYNYFRLRMVDKDGQYSYSDMIELFVNNSPEKLGVFPNPTKNNLTITDATLGSQLILMVL